MRTRLGLLEVEDRPANHYFLAVFEECPKDVAKIERPRLTVMDRQKVDPEILLKLGELIKLIQDNIRILALLDLNHHSHAGAIGFVTKIRDSFDFFLFHEIGDLLDHLGLVDLVGDLRDDDPLPIPFEALDFRPAPDRD